MSNKQNDIIKEDMNEQVYETLRIFHSDIKDMLNSERFELMSTYQKNSIETLHGLLYLAEAHFTDF